MSALSLSARAGMLGPSPTLGITAKANAMKAEGIDVVSFAAGEPDFNTPEPIIQVAIDALEAGFTKYTPSAGIKDLRDAIVAKLARENSVCVKPEQVVVSCGAKHSVYNTCQVLVNPGDEVILIAPYWMTYAEQIKLAGGVPKVVHTTAESGYVPSYDQLRKAITKDTKAIIVNSPSNPTGAVLPRQTIKEIAQLALRHNFWIISDEIYERLSYGEPPQSFAALGKEVADRTVTINGVSKTYAMTGWRIGFAAAPAEVAKAMSNFQDQVTSNPTSFAQKGAVAAYKMAPESVEAMRVEFQARRDLIVAGLRGIDGVKIVEPKGAFYAFTDVSAFLQGDIKDDVALGEYLLAEARVATIPGSVFEGPGHLRLSYAASREAIQEGVRRLGEALAKVGPA
ncbi:pyridoxal phosphate-dependent aminotransferase [soil metagenome]